MCATYVVSSRKQVAVVVMVIFIQLKIVKFTVVLNKGLEVTVGVNDGRRSE